MKLAHLLLALLGSATLCGGTAAQADDLVPYQVVDGTSIPKPLTNEPGDPKRGKAIAINRKQGNCLACHDLPIPEQPFHGNVGPDLSAIATLLKAGELRLRIVNPKVVNADTMMPAFYHTEGLHRVLKKFQGKPILSAQQVEDVIAYLETLKGGKK